MLRHLKARHTEPRDLTLEFDRTLQRFSTLDHTWRPTIDSGKFIKTLSTAWSRVTTVDDESDGEA